MDHGGGGGEHIYLYRNIYPENIPSRKQTAKTPENGWLEDDRFLLGFGPFSGAFAVSFDEGRYLDLDKVIDHFVPW